MEQELIKEFILECKQKQEWVKEWNNNHIEFDNYFKYSGCTEELVHIERNPAEITIITDDPIIEFFYDHPDHSMQDIAYIFEVSYTTIKKRLEMYFAAYKIAKFKDKRSGNTESRITKHDENQ